MKRWPILFLLLLSGFTSRAYHIAGGDLTTQWLGGNSFQVTLTLYRDCSNPSAANFDPTIIIAAYTMNGSVLQDSFHVNLSTVVPLELAGAGCIPPPAVCMEKGDYIRTIQLPPSSGGFYLVWERCCRNSTVTNLNNPDRTGMTFYHEMANPVLNNSSPVFNSAPLPYTCAGQFFRFNFDATDADGDSLVYSLSDPLAGGYSSNQNPNPFSATNSQGGGNLAPEPLPYLNAVWEFGYSLANICGGTVPLTINPATGLVEGIPDDPGFYAMAVTIEEYRNGILIGRVRREIEFTVIICDDNAAPNLSANVANYNYEIYATDTLNFEVKARDPDGDSIFLVHTGEVFSQSPAAGLSAPYAISSDTVGVDSVSVNFYWETTCNQARDSVYKVVYEIKDNGCPIPLLALGKVFIRVKPVPIIEKPNLLCLGLENDLVHVYKNPQPEILDRYFLHYKLYRSVNGGPYQVIQNEEDPAKFILTDSTAADPFSNDYCYFISGVNTCGEEGIVSDTLCSITQVNTTVNYIEVVSVKDKNTVSLRWEDFPDGQYGTYIIERRNNEPGSLFSEIARLSGKKDYDWEDPQTFTDKQSYCYRMKNINFCENESEYSKEACTILLSGEAKPFYNNLSWTPYSEWRGGVQSYMLERSGLATNTPFGPIVQLSAQGLAFEDREIPLSGGVFNYRVHAFEGSGGSNAESFSNQVELVQSPLLYVPNAFSPNEDANNNTWGPAFAYVKNLEIQVFNRWGQRVFYTNTFDQTWDGKYNGNDCPQGVYFQNQILRLRKTRHYRKNRHCNANPLVNFILS
ncbi:MAG: gliding motility-associated C-terminal domain-containing protein [Bacteroidetes bacterium]|nr:gliding motility-associated C-terminal domain-containing protein [Bacteroidota bacterium]